VITVIILTLLVISIAVAWVVARRRRAEAVRSRREIPLFTIPASQIPGLPRPGIAAAHLNTVTTSYEPPAAPMRGGAVEVDWRLAASRATIRTRDGAVSTVARPAPVDAPFSIDDEMGEAVDGASIRFWRPADGTLQFLPGRLEIAAGRDAGQEIRFVSTGGPDGTCITFGRADGPPYRHVQLSEPTVSRSHARMVLDQPTSGSRDGSPSHARWRLENLSSTNPVVINGRSLDANGGAMASVVLSEGDRIEMGEVAFVFRER